MQKEQPEDRRVFARFSANLPLRFLDSDSNFEGQAQVQDISAKGLGLVTNAKLNPRSSLEMWLEIPDKGESLYTRGEVVWLESQGVNEYRAGINLEKADLMGLSRVMRLP
jgi:Tfp pilus assembly protein PilZ